MKFKAQDVDSILSLYAFIALPVASRPVLKNHAIRKLYRMPQSLSSKIFGLTKGFIYCRLCPMSALTTKDAAEKLGVSPRRILQFIDEGRLPAERFGRDYMIKESDLKLVQDRKPGRPPGKKKVKG